MEKSDFLVVLFFLLVLSAGLGLFVGRIIFGGL